MIARAWEAWVRLWSHREPPHVLALLRVTIALAILADFLDMARRGLVVPCLGAHAAGGLGDPLAADVPWAYLVLPATAAGAWALWGLVVATCAMVIAGAATPLAIVLLVLIYAQTSHVLPIADRAIDRLLRDVLVILAFSSAGRFASIDAWWRTGSPWGDGRDVPAWPRHLVILQILVMYFQAGVAKLGYDWTPMGGFEALWLILQDPALARFDASAHPWLHPVTRVGTAVTVAWEWSAPAVIFAYLARHRGGRAAAFVDRWRPHLAWLSIGVVFHVGIALTLKLGIFPWAMLATYPAFLHPRELGVRARSP